MQPKSAEDQAISSKKAASENTRTSRLQARPQHTILFSSSARRLGAEKYKQNGHDHYGHAENSEARDHQTLAVCGPYHRRNIGNEDLSRFCTKRHEVFTTAASMPSR